MKKILSVLIVAILLLSGLSAFAEAQEPITIRIAWWGDTMRHERYNGIMDAFEEMYPWITVEREYGTWNDYWDKLATQVAGGNAPDVMGMHQQYAADYINRGTTLPLNDYIAEGVIDTSKMSQAVLDGCTVNDQIVMLPMGITVTTILVNKTLCDSLGVEIPASGDMWSWADLQDVARDFRAKAEAAGQDDLYFIVDRFAINEFQNYARGKGHDLYTEDGNLAFTVEDVEEWYSLWADLRADGAMPEAEFVSEEGTKTLEQGSFANQKIAAIMVPVNQLYLYVAQMPDCELVCEMMPTGNDGTHAAYLEGAHWAISSAIDEAHQDAAALLIDFLENKQESWERMLMDQGVPANSEMAEFVSGKVDAVDAIAIDFVNTTTEVVPGGFAYPPTGATEIKALFQEYQEYTMFGYTSVEEAAATFYAGAEEILAKNK